MHAPGVSLNKSIELNFRLKLYQSVFNSRIYPKHIPRTLLFRPSNTYAHMYQINYTLRIDKGSSSKHPYAASPVPVLVVSPPLATKWALRADR